jgi:hypothetical protein
MRKCVVSYVDTSGIRHSVEVQADSLFEAAVLAVRTLREHDCAPGEINKLEIEVRTSVTHEITLKRVRQWLTGGARSPKEAVAKERLREILENSRWERWARITSTLRLRFAGGFLQWATHPSHPSSNRKPDVISEGMSFLWGDIYRTYSAIVESDDVLVHA